jgi:hypothetical protein
MIDDDFLMLQKLKKNVILGRSPRLQERGYGNEAEKAIEIGVFSKNARGMLLYGLLKTNHSVKKRNKKKNRDKCKK